MGILSSLGQAFQQPQTNGAPDYSKRKFGGIIGAIASGIAPQAYSSGRDVYENRVIGGLSDPNEKIRAAQQMGRYDLVDKLQQYKEAQRKADYNAAMTKAAQGYHGFGQQMPPTMPAQQAQQAPQVQSITPQMEADAAQSMPMVGFENSPPAQLPMAAQQQPNDGSFVTVTGQHQKPAPAPQFAQKSNPYEQADYLDYMAKIALQNGGFQEYQDYAAQAQKARQDAMTMYNQSISANIAPALMVKDNPDTPDYNEADAAFNKAMDMMPYALPTEWQGLLNDPQTRRQAAQMLINMGNPKEAANTAIDVQGSYDQFRPYQANNLGDRYGTFDPKTGKYISFESVGLNPTQVRGQNMTRENNIRSTAVSRENNRNSVGAAIRGQNIREEELQYNRSIGAPANVGGVNNDFSGEGW